ncbi:MAG: hypothetical protein AAF291_07810 [Pseudomonadota bacterium]
MARGLRQAQAERNLFTGGSAFCRRYGLNRLVHAQPHPEIADANAREKAMKAWKRAWKIKLIDKSNPEWHDLFDTSP